MNADENIQDPTNTQNYNKYGYVMNNPMMYNDPNGEFWWWVAGAIAAGYISGVQANGGNWNPVKWNWQSTWSSVLGGAIGGAAISGALGNITSNAGAIKNMLPGIVSGGLNSAFTGSNFLSGLAGGISYTSNLFDNKITSTDGTSAGYKYIINPGYNDELSELSIYEKDQLQNCCPDLALQLTRGITVSAGTGVAAIGFVANIVFGSAHVPDYQGRNYTYSNVGSRTFSVSDVKTEANSYPVRERRGQVGSYTILFDQGYKYHGKGPIDRMFISALFQMGVHKTTVSSFNWTPSISDR